MSRPPLARSSSSTTRSPWQTTLHRKTKSATTVAVEPGPWRQRWVPSRTRLPLHSRRRRRARVDLGRLLAATAALPRQTTPSSLPPLPHCAFKLQSRKPRPVTTVSHTTRCRRPRSLANPRDRARVRWHRCLPRTSAHTRWLTFRRHHWCLVVPWRDRCRRRRVSTDGCWVLTRRRCRRCRQARRRSRVRAHQAVHPSCRPPASSRCCERRSCAVCLSWVAVHGRRVSAALTPHTHTWAREFSLTESAACL